MLLRLAPWGLLFLVGLCASSSHAARGQRFRQVHHLPAATGEAAPEDSLGAWVGFRNGFQNTGRSPVSVRPLFPGASGRQPWSHPTQGLIWGTPVIDAAGNVYVGSADKVFYALTASGQVRWTYTLPDAGDSLVDSAAALTPNGLVVVPGGDGTLHALRQSDGQRAWSFDAYHAGDHDSGVTVNSFEGNVTLGPDGNLYAGSDNGHLYSLDLEGHERWNFRTGMMIWSAPAFAPDGSWMAFGSLDNHLYLLDPATGAEIARYEASGEIKSSPAVGSDGAIYLGASDFTFRCLELRPGHLWGQRLATRWKVATGGDIYSSAALADGKVVFASHDGYLYCRTEAGDPVWRYGIHDRISGSPLITADGVVIVGAKNGKLYAIDLESGERLWSFKVVPGHRKVNLDSSPAMDATGRIVLGSYDGRVYAVPVEFPPQHPDDPRVDLDPGADVPDFGGAVPPDGATLRVMGPDGSLHAAPPEPLAPHQGLTFRVVGHDQGAFAPNTAVAVAGLKVTVDPPLPVEVVLASDSYRVNVYPKAFWAPGTRYTLKVRGRTYRRGNPFVDLIKWWNLPAFEFQTSFDTAAAAPPLPMPTDGRLLRYAVRGLYAIQPEILDTLIPAALEGQGYQASVAFVDPGRGRVGMVVLPGFPQPDGSVTLRPAPEKAFVVDGDLAGGDLRAAGKLNMAAMGGTIPFTPFRISGRLLEDRIEGGRFHATADVWRIKGNGGTYTGISWAALDDMADSRLRLQAMGTLEGSRLPPLDHGVVQLGHGWTGKTGLELTLRLGRPLEGAHLVSVAFWDQDRGAMSGHATVALGAPGGSLPAGPVQVRFPGLKRSALQGARLAVLFDGEAVPPAR